MPCYIYYSYLKNRSECVSVNSVKISFIEIIPGVRQGSADKTYSIQHNFQQRLGIENDNKLNFFFKLLFGCPTANFWPFSRGQPHSPDVNHWVFTFFEPRVGHWEPRKEVGSLSPTERLVGFEPGTFRFLLQHLYPLGHSPTRPLQSSYQEYL